MYNNSTTTKEWIVWASGQLLQSLCAPSHKKKEPKTPRAVFLLLTLPQVLLWFLAISPVDSRNSFGSESGDRQGDCAKIGKLHFIECGGYIIRWGGKICQDKHAHEAEESCNKTDSCNEKLRAEWSTFWTHQFFFFLSTSLCICKRSGDIANTCGPGEHHKAASGLLTELQCDIWIAVWLESWTTII